MGIVKIIKDIVLATGFVVQSTAMSYGNLHIQGKKDFLGGQFTFDHLVVQLSVPVKIPSSVLRTAFDAAYSSAH